jgi:hypothetical protein
MSTAIVTAIIAFTGVVASVVASLFTSKRQADIEVQKLRAEIRQTYAGKLLEKRIDVYPALYKLLSDFDKMLRLDKVSRSVVEELLRQIFEWDSENALIMSGYAGRILYEFRKLLMDWLQLQMRSGIDFRRSVKLNLLSRVILEFMWLNFQTKRGVLVHIKRSRMLWKGHPLGAVASSLLGNCYLTISLLRAGRIDLS